MKTKMHPMRGLTAIALMFALAITSCKKDDSSVSAGTTTEDPIETASTIEASSQDAQTEAQFDDVFNITASMNSSQVGEDLGIGANVSGLYDLGGRPDTAAPCFTITVVPNIPHVFPKTVTIDFGTGCQGHFLLHWQESAAASRTIRSNPG